MSFPLTITFRHVPRSGALESAARDLGHQLQSLHSRITACHIVMEGKPNAGEEVPQFAVRIHLSVPGAQIHADSAQPSGSAYSEARTALRAAFDNAKRQIDAFRRRHLTHVSA
jgi:hypothetical protein